MIDEALERALDRAIGFVRFAEAKNATLLAVSVALGGGIAQFIVSLTLSDMEKGISVIIFTVFLFLWIDVALSFVPLGRKKSLRLDQRITDPNKLNVLYFGDQSRMDAKTFLQGFYAHLPAKESNYVEECFADQIIQNAQICEKKLRHFNRAIKLLIVEFFCIFALCISHFGFT